MRAFAAGFSDFSAGLHFLEDRNNLAFTESRFLHVELLCRSKLYFKLVRLYEVVTVHLQQC